MEDGKPTTHDGLIYVPVAAHYWPLDRDLNKQCSHRFFLLLLGSADRKLHYTTTQVCTANVTRLGYSKQRERNGANGAFLQSICTFKKCSNTPRKTTANRCNSTGSVDNDSTRRIFKNKRRTNFNSNRNSQPKGQENGDCLQLEGILTSSYRLRLQCNCSMQQPMGGGE